MDLGDAIKNAGVYNPYDFGNPVSDTSLFAGRSAELKDINYYLDLAGKAPRPINIVLTGPRSSGKTSLLNIIDAEAKSRGHVIVRIDLNEGDADPFSLFYKIYDGVLIASVEAGTFAGPSGRVFEEYRDTIDSGVPVGTSTGTLRFPRHYAIASSSGRSLSEPTLKADLKTISAETGRLFVLIFDECDVLGKSRIELELLRNVFMNLPGYMLVFAGTPNLFPVMEEVFSPIIRQFKKIPVNNFTDVDDTEKCISRPLELLDIQPSEVLKPTEWQLIDEVHSLSGGRPYEIQLLCHFMFKRVEAGDARNLEITLDVLDDVRQELEQQDDGSDRTIIGALRRLDASDFHLLQALTEFRGSIAELSASSKLFRVAEPAYEPDELQVAFDSFAGMGLVEVDEKGVVRFSGDQFDEVYARYVAAASSARLSVWYGDFLHELDSELRRVVDTIDGVNSVFLPAEWSRIDLRRRMDEAISALINPMTRRSMPDAVLLLYPRLLRAFEFSRLIVGLLTLSVLNTTVEFWLTVSPAKVDDFLGDERMVRIREQAEALGGTFTAEFFEKELQDRAELIPKIRAAASPNQLEAFGDSHYSFGLQLYRRGDHIGARREFVESNNYSGSPHLLNSIAHVSLIVEDYSTAEEYASRSREAAWSSFESVDLVQYALATYDLTMALLMQGSELDLDVLLVEALEVLEPPSSTGYLAVPIVAENQVRLQGEEVRDLRSKVSQVRNDLIAYAAQRHA